MLTPTELDLLDEFSKFNKSEYPVICSLLATLLKEHESLKEDLCYWRYHDSND